MSARDALAARLRSTGSVFAEEEADLLLAAAPDPGAREALVVRRMAGEPLEQVLGWVEFCGLRLAVAPGVFVPRQRTAALVDRATGLVRDAGHDALLLDLCCGVGAIAAAVAARVPGLRVLAADVDPAATGCAARNLAGADARVLTGDLFAPLPVADRGRVAVLTANVPYVPTAAIGLMPPEARDHEARAALDGGADGLDAARRVLTGAADWLAPGGTVLVEVAEAQGPAALAAARAAGLEPRLERDDDRETTVLLAQRPSG
ncbi:putative protein N(5)-glutamine methyltransferase [Microlunatus kandeliicorticis]|uniref:putative protein N(5)-glutamine methyltransferase n=1 Tax=Microlunatus kandeliicorticis TaxID=1759536 RepID=UPI0015F7E658|nr:putative protein N(5)-glutamine methyltransferase [Microlunatus kandeliicorticis]